MKAVVFSSVGSGGIVQFSHTFSKALRELGHEATEYYPEECACEGEWVVKYPHVQQQEVLLGIPNRVTALADDIVSRNPDIAFFVDDVLGSSVVATLLARRVPTYLVVHDPRPHPSNQVSIRKRIASGLTARFRRKAFHDVSGIIVLSRNSADAFSELHPELEGKTYLMPLGAHPVEAYPEKPIDLVEEDFLLFFGRIDKYKGLARLFRAYRSASVQGCLLPLIVAGGGELTNEELKLAGQPDIVILNRFIDDGEMAWLFNHAAAVVLPYIEATQSGVLAMAYHYGKPVICSNLPGLAEFVEDGATGRLCEDENALSQALLEMSAPGIAASYHDEVMLYESRNLDWKTNVDRFLEGILHAGN